MDNKWDMATKRAASSNRRARRAGVIGRLRAGDIVRQARRQRWVCPYCGNYCRHDWSVDHVVPIARGGSNLPGNIVIACPTCNRRKGDMPGYIGASGDGAAITGCLKTQSGCQSNPEFSG